MTRQTLALLGWLVIVLVPPVDAQPKSKQEASDFRAVVTNAATVLRRFQSPETVLREWGDPEEASGAYSPSLTYVGGAMRMGFMKLTLRYAPPANAPYRLAYIYLDYLGLPKERDLIEWLGPPARTKREDANKDLRKENARAEPHIVVTMYWDGNDRAGLGVKWLTMYPAYSAYPYTPNNPSRAKTMIYLDGSPRR
jgi:hypothetical protein